MRYIKTYESRANVLLNFMWAFSDLLKRLKICKNMERLSCDVEEILSSQYYMIKNDDLKFVVEIHTGRDYYYELICDPIFNEFIDKLKIKFGGTQQNILTDKDNIKKLTKELDSITLEEYEIFANSKKFNV